jgi:hypothetical protein
VAESGGLENRCTRKGTVGSNPTLSASFVRMRDEGRRMNKKDESSYSSFFPPPSSFWRGAGVAELAALEMLCTGNRTVGSNPTLSAMLKDEGGRMRDESEEFESRIRSLLVPHPSPLILDLSGSGRRAITRLRIPPGRERSNGSSLRMCRGLSGA